MKTGYAEVTMIMLTVHGDIFIGYGTLTYNYGRHCTIYKVSKEGQYGRSTYHRDMICDKKIKNNFKIVLNEKA